MRSPALFQNLLAFLVVTFLLYLLFAIVIYFVQERMLYFPTVDTRRQTIESASRLGLELWPNDADDYRGLVSRVPPAEHKGTVLVL